MKMQDLKLLIFLELIGLVVTSVYWIFLQFNFLNMLLTIIIILFIAFLFGRYICVPFLDWWFK